jgi:kynureninase
MESLYSSEEINNLALSLQPFYSRFKVATRLLFSGHSHQAWPDAALNGMREYEEVVAELVDKKWGIVFEKIEVLKRYLREYYEDPLGHYSYGTNTHTLLVSWVSSLDLEKKRKIITTTGEFHSLYRQLQLSQFHKTADIVEVKVEPIETLTERLLS